ncbi:MAG: DUF1203 domain-containing protein [Geminicoccales bacterium]
MSFQISALPIEPFQDLFGLDDDRLEAKGVRRMIVDECPGFPCRLSLKDMEVGDSVLLLNYEHQPTSSPYRSSHAIFIGEGSVQATLSPGEVPLQLQRRLLSMRGFDADGMMIDADVLDGADLAQSAERMLADPSISYLHVHNAKRGCYAARIDRC